MFTKRVQCVVQVLMTFCQQFTIYSVSIKVIIKNLLGGGFLRNYSLTLLTNGNSLWSPFM